MRFYTAASRLLASSLALPQYAATTPTRALREPTQVKHADIVKPKVFIISMFKPEGDVWYGIPEFDLLARNITVPGFSILYPDAHCTATGEICQLVTGEAGILSTFLHVSSDC